jgi:hypothetical protein
MDLNGIISLYGHNGEYISSLLLLVFSVLEFVQIWGYLRGKNHHELNFYIPLMFLIQVSFATYGFVFDYVIFLINVFGLTLTPLMLFLIFHYGSNRA